VHCPCGMRVIASLQPGSSVNPRLQEAVTCAYFNGIGPKPSRKDRRRVDTEINHGWAFI